MEEKMEFQLTIEQIEEWCRIPFDELCKQEGLNAAVRLSDTKEQTMTDIGNLMAEEMIRYNKEGRITRWILPAGPMEQYTTFIDRVNREKISLKNLYVFHMDEFLDWEGRPYPVEEKFCSLRGTMQGGFYDRIDPKLNVPVEQRIWPDIHDPDCFDRKVEEMGGIDTTWAGIGCKGLIAFCEAPHSRYHRITREQFKNGKTRIREINEDTIVALAQRTFGGFYDMVPPMAITVGMKSILTSKRIVFMITTGAWKNTVIRILLMCKEPVLEYPVTFLTQYIPEKILCCDKASCDHPLSHKMKLW